MTAYQNGEIKQSDYRTGGTVMTQARIFFIFGTAPITGGDFVSMDHVATLNALGFNAQAFFLRIDEVILRLGIPITQPGTQIEPDDIVVVGEADRALLEPVRDLRCIKVLHNQNPYYTFLGFSEVKLLNDFGFRSILVPSDFCAARLSEIGVRVPISRVHPSLPDYFKPSPKRPQIAYSPRKRPYEAAFLRAYFQAQMPEYAHLPWISISQMPRAQVATVMAESTVYAAFPMLESLGLMNLEAMASGCHVVGYTGIGGIEYATTQNGDWVTDGDHLAFIAQLRQALRSQATQEDAGMIAAARETAARFSRPAFERELTTAWLSIMGENAHRYRKA